MTFKTHFKPWPTENAVYCSTRWESVRQYVTTGHQFRATAPWERCWRCWAVWKMRQAKDRDDAEDRLEKA